MLYNITPEQEKTALNAVLKTMPWDNKLRSLIDTQLLLSNLVEISDVEQKNKLYIVTESLYNIIFDTFVKDKNFEANYKNCKSLYENYVNQDLFGAIRGLSLTVDHLQQLTPKQTNDDWQLAEYNEALIACLFFDFSKNSDEFYRAFDKFLKYEDITGYFNLLLLLLEGNHFTAERVQKIVTTNQDTGDGGSMIFFAACPDTKSWLTKTNFIEEYKSLLECSMSHSYHKQAIKEVSIAYQDLFNEDFNYYALEAIKEIDNYDNLSKEFYPALYKNSDDFSLNHKFEIHSELLRLNHTPYSDDHYKNMLSCYRNHSSLHVPAHLTRLAKSYKTQSMIVRDDFTICLNDMMGDWYMANYDLNELKDAYQDLFHEDLVINTESL